ncbi:MAG: hypothetical protein M3495_20655 [Pseudomonadota bacterium]|nr:hypothetical protein [Gammaproteobacteria bacterium]MDQ3583853.1 hypothetical protein [Pseudomonadota bacterium]
MRSARRRSDRGQTPRGGIDGPDLADLIALMPRERVRERFATLIKDP